MLPLLRGLAACGPRPQPTQDVEAVVSAILIASAQKEQPAGTPPVTSTPAASATPSPTMTCFWPLDLPQEFVLSRENSLADAEGFELIFSNASNQGAAMSLRPSGGAVADYTDFCANQEAVTVRGLDGCFPVATGAGFAVEWQENGAHDLVGGMGFSRELALATAEHLEAIDLATFLARLDHYHGD